MLWLLAARKKKLLRPLRLLLKHLLLPTLPLPRPLPTLLLPPLRLTLLLPLRKLLRPLLTLLLLLRPLLRKPLTLLLPSNQRDLIRKTGLRAGFFFACTAYDGGLQAAEASPLRRLRHVIPAQAGIQFAGQPARHKKTGLEGRFFTQSAHAYFNSSVSRRRILAPVSPVSDLPSLVCTVTSLAAAPCSAFTITR